MNEESKIVSSESDYKPDSLRTGTNMYSSEMGADT